MSKNIFFLLLPQFHNTGHLNQSLRPTAPQTHILEHFNQMENQGRREVTRNLRRTPRVYLLVLQGGRNPLTTLPTIILPHLNGNGVMSPKNHLDQFITIHNIHLVFEDDVMVRDLLQTLV